jgi:hypothetical protein
MNFLCQQGREEAIISYRGKPWIKRVPYKIEKSTGESSLFGIWKDNKELASVEEYIRNLRKNRE